MSAWLEAPYVLVTAYFLVASRPGTGSLMGPFSENAHIYSFTMAIIGGSFCAIHVTAVYESLPADELTGGLKQHASNSCSKHVSSLSCRPSDKLLTRIQRHAF